MNSTLIPIFRKVWSSSVTAPNVALLNQIHVEQQYDLMDSLFLNFIVGMKCFPFQISSSWSLFSLHPFTCVLLFGTAAGGRKNSCELLIAFEAQGGVALRLRKLQIPLYIVVSHLCWQK